MHKAEILRSKPESPKRHGDSMNHVEGYRSPLSAKLVVSPPATMM
jgi:hypothetical protein